MPGRRAAEARSGRTSSSPPAPREEARLLPPPEGPGYAPVYIGATLDHGKYEIVRKLGWGVGSTVWLAKTTTSEQPQTYVAIKVLTVRNSDTIKESRSLEDVVLWMLKIQADSGAALPGLRHCLVAADIFDEQDTHLCFVTRPCAQSVHQLRGGLTLEQFPLSVVKSVVHQTLSAVAFLHNTLGMIHLDLKWSNILVDLPENADRALEKYLRENPPQAYPPLPGQDVATTVSQPVPISAFGVSRQDIQVCLGDFGAVHPGRMEWPAHQINTPPLLRPPESLDFGSCSYPADIWALGCLVYELLIPGPPLFLPRPTGGGYRMGDILDRINVRLGLGGPAIRSEHAAQAGDSGSGASVADALDNADLETLVRSSPDVRVNLSEREIADVCAFIRRCLVVDPKARPTAAQLLEDEWFKA